MSPDEAHRPARWDELGVLGRWDEAGAVLAREARSLVGAGAELIVLCTNTMHKVAETIADAVDVPFVHVADTTAEAVRRAGLASVGLLATAYTMEQDFYVGRLRDRHGLVMRSLADRGAEGILLGCTEIDLLVGAEDSPVPVFDTTRLHAERAVELALSD
ncbi:MAG TPA: aspartate/glutamate racemase family protein [Solirubrobacteraceae bacterium]